MPYDNNEIMRNVPERLRGKVKGIGAPPTITDEPQETGGFDLPIFGPIAGNTITFNKAAELASNAIDTIKETNAYKKYFYNDAEKLAEAQKISGDLKIPVNAILANDTNLEKARDIYNYKQKQQQIMPDGEKSFDMKAVYAAYPELQKLANMDETQAAIALHNIENVKQTHGIIEAFKTGWHLDTLQLERSKLGQKGYYGELTEADRKRLTEIEEEMKNAKVLPDLLEAPVESVVGNTAQQAPMMFRQFMNGQMFAIGSAVVGATVGAAGGFAGGGVTAVPGAAYGARIGYGIGSRIGFAKEMYNEILGNYYLDYIGYKDRQGRQLMSDTQARAWATLSTLAETGIEMANVESVIGILGSNPGTKEAANIVRDIVRRGADRASAKAQLKNWLANNARNMGVVALSESAEEGVQNAVSMGINTMAAKANPGGNIPSYSAVEMAQGAIEGAWQALPASIGFGAMAAAGSNLKYVRRVATAANEGREYIENARKNEAGIEMVANLLNNKAASKLAKEQPEVYKNVIKNTLEGSGAENVYVDTELLMQQEGGVQILHQLAAAAGIEGQALQNVIETKADIAVPVQDYVSMDGAQELHDKLRDLISFAVGADCFARNRKIAQQMKKTYDKMIAGDMERALQNIHNLAAANFEEGPQRDMAEFVLGQYENPVEGIKEYRAERQRELDNMLDPVLATMREGMGQGVAMLKDEDSGHYYRMSNNDPWYSKYYAENKKSPTQGEMKQIAEDILTGNNYYGVPGFDFRDAEAMEWAEANRAQIETIRQELETLDAIEEKIGNISKGELAAMEGLTPEGIRVYRRVAQELKNAPSKAVRQQAVMGALLTAHRAEIYAEAMRRAGNTDYTAEDYINRIRFEMDGNGGGGYNQAAISGGNLVAYHNTNEKALMSALEAGGLAVPSIAITNKEFDYDNFGNITLIGTRDLIDPANRTDVYSRDAYTTRTPRTEYKKMKSADLKAFAKKWAKEFEKIDPREYAELEYHLSNGNMRSAYDNFISSRTIKYYYLTNVLDKKIELPREQQLKSDIFKDEQFARELREIIKNRANYTDEELHNTITEKATAAAQRLWKKDPEARDVMIEVYSNPEEHYILMDELRSDLNNNEKPVDRFALGRLLDDQYRNELTNGDYERWAKKRFEQYAGEPQLKIGNRYYPYNLENLVKAMLKNKGAGKEDTLAYNSSVVAANAARKFKSVDEIRKFADRLAKSEDVEKQIDDINELAGEYQRLVAQYYKYGADSWDAFDDAMKALSNSMTANADSTAPKLKRALENLEFENVPDNIVEAGVKVANALKHAATQYFEAKPQRAVRIEEFAGAVVPKGTNPELINRLKEAGLQVEEYDKTVPGSRRAATQKVQNAAQSANGNVFFQSAYHGTPHSFEQFDLGAIGTGEGAQAHGWGLYFAADRKIADEYRNRLSDNVKDITTDRKIADEYRNRLSDNVKDITIGNKKYKQLQSSGIVDENGNEPEDVEYTAAYYLGVYRNKNEALKNIEKEIENPEEYIDDYYRSVLKKAKELLENNETEVSKSEGIVFEVDVPENDVLLNENKTLDEQPENVKNTLRKMAENQVRDMNGYYNQFADAVLIADPKEVNGRDIYRCLVNVVGNARTASIMLNENGIKGITYYGGTDGRCFVVFDDKAISIINRYNQSAGLRARTANWATLQDAQHMANEGALQKEIYEKTGWRRGTDGKWRFEIPDNLDKIDIKKLQGTKRYFELGEIYDNEKLYEAYPFLRELPVMKEKLDGNQLGYSEGHDLIVIDEDVDEWFTPGTIIHELQHIIQAYEGFASGGNPQQVRTLVNEAVRQKTEEARSLAPHATTYYNRRREYEMAAIMGDEARMKELEGPLKKLEQEIPAKGRRDRIYKLFSEADSLLRKANNTNDKQLYRNLYGEKEAKAAEEKAKISTEMERTRNAGRPLDDILNEYLPKLPDEMKPLAEEYIELQKLPPGDEKFDREFEIENILLTDKNGEDFYDAVSASMWDSGTLEKQQQDFDEAVFDVERGDAIVLFNDNLVASYSMAEPQVQGQTAIMDNGKRVVYLFENADQSTFMHEMAHIFFADMRELAEMKKAPAQIKRDWETLKNWTAWNGSQIDEYIGTAVYNEFRQRDKEIRSALEEGYTFRNGERIELGMLLEEWRQERFARAFEEYLREGKAPKESLKSVFSRFKNWLLKIYKDIKTIGAEPSKEVKAVMDRMLATQEEIDAVMQKEDIDAFRKAGGFKYLSGTSAEMWEKIYADIHKDAYSKVIKIAMQDLTEQGRKEREQKIADERIAVRERISQEPVFIVWQYLQNNPQLDKEAAAQQIGGMTAEQYDFKLNTRGGSLDAAVEREMRSIIAEIDAESPNKAELEQRAQEAVDTSYYKKLLTAYELEALNKSVKAEQKTSRKINDTADEGAARAISRLDRERARRENYEEEIKRLREQRGEERRQQRALRDVAAGNVETIREYAERKISALPVMEAANPVMWKKLSRQRARETEEAIAKNDWETARKAKKEQLVYDVMTDLATGNKKIVDKGVSTMKHRADIIRRSKNLGASDRYVYNHLLYVFGLAKRDAPMPPDYEGFVKTIVNYDQNLELTFIDTDGTVLLPDWLLNAGTATRPRDKGYIDLTVEDFKLLKDVMDNIYTAGREAKMAKAVTDREGKKVDLDEAAAKIVKTITDTAFKKQTQDKKFGDESKIDMAARLAEEASMSLIKPETILRAMGDTAMRYIYDPLREAANTEMKMNETLRQQQAGILGAYRDGKVAKYLAQGLSQSEAEKRAESELNEMGSKKQYSIGNEQITKENLLAIALNWGTDINRKRVVDGYQVSYGFIEHALRQLDAADWQFVQNVWDLFETYWPDLQRVEANVTGVTLEKQPAMSFKIIGADGGVYNLNGGYYPLKYDAKKNIVTSQREADEAARVNMQGASRLGMNLGNTKERVQGHVSLRIRTDLGVIDEALTDTVHNIAMRETVRDVIRLINNNEIREAVNDNWGAATWRTLNTWALDCWAVEPRSKSAYEKASQWLRTRQTQAVLGFRVSTALLNICNIGPMMEYIGAAEAVKAINDFYAHPQAQYNTIMSKSVFLRNRAETMDRDFGKLVKDNSNSAITKSAFWLITKTDLMLACPLWMHEYQKEYQKGMAKGGEPVSVEAAAIRAGDAAVRRVFGSGQTVDLAAVQRGGEFEKMFTMFYSYFSVVHNAVALKVWEARKAKVDGKKLTQAMAPVIIGTIYWMAIPAVIEAGIRAMIDDDDDDILDVAEGAGITFISTAVGGIPVLRDALPMALKAAAGEPVYNIRNNPLNETAAQMLNVTRALSSDNKDVLDVARAVLRMADMITGLPQILTDGMIAAARWIDEGDLTEEDIQHYLWSILFGQNSKK